MKNFIYEKLFSNDELDNLEDNDSLIPEKTLTTVDEFTKLKYLWEEMGLFNKQYDPLMYVRDLNPEKIMNGIVVLDSLVIQCTSLKLLDKFIDSLLIAGGKFRLRYLGLYLEEHINKRPINKININNLYLVIDKIDFCCIYGGIFDNFKGLPDNIFRIDFHDTSIKSLDGLPEKLSGLSFVYKTYISSVQDWSCLPKNLKVLLICYKYYQAITKDKLLSFYNFPEYAVNINTLNLIPEQNIVDDKGKFLKYYGQCIKDKFKEDTPNMNKKILRQIINNFKIFLSNE